jgi:Icc-related predicted phosphoesterase
MKIVAIADTHNTMPILPEGDVLVHAGDISMNGTKKEIDDFDAWLGTLNFKYKLIIPGNHDFWFREHNRELRNGTLLCNQHITIDGIKFFGSPYSVTFGNWAFMLPDALLKSVIWSRIEPDTMVLITHSPPKGILDFGCSGQNSGSESLLDRIKEIKPKIHIFGHIHEGYGIRKDYTEFVNASVVDEYYREVHKPIELSVLPN